MLLLEGEDISCRRPSKAGKDGPCKRNAQTLTDHASRCQQARSRALLRTRGRAHHCPGIGSLKNALPNPCEGKPPDNIPALTLLIQLAEQAKTVTDKCQPARSSPAPPKATCEQTSHRPY